MAETFGRMMRKHRKAAGLTLAAMAQKMGVSTAYISKVEAGGAVFTLERIFEAADFLEVETAPLVAAAATARGRIEMPPFMQSPRAQQLLAAMARAPDMDDAQFTQLVNQQMTGKE